MIERDELLHFFRRTLRVDVGKLTDDTPLFSSGVVDSFQLVEFIAFVEGRIGRRLGVDEVTLENFDTLGRVQRFISRCSGAPADNA